jgi:predicted ribosomally synthesized peptide with nif11-like leader
MSQNTLTISGLEDFIQLVLEDQVLQDKLQACSDEESLVSLVVQLGQERGYRFTDEEVREKLAQIREEQEFTYPLSGIVPQHAYF